MATLLKTAVHGSRSFTATMTPLFQAALHGEIDRLSSNPTAAPSPSTPTTTTNQPNSPRTAALPSPKPGSATPTPPTPPVQQPQQQMVVSAANVNTRDTFGRTMLHYAVAGGVKSCVATLLDRGADPSIPDTSGSTPLHYAALLGATDMAEMIIKAATSSTSPSGRRPREDSEPSRSMVSPACLAAACGHPKLAELLLNTTPGSASKNSSSSMLHFTALGGVPTLATAVIKHNKGTPSIDAKDARGMTALHMACSAGKGDMALHLMTAGADPNIQDAQGWAAAHHAAAGDLSHVLVKFKKSELEAKDVKGRTPLHIAALFGASLAVSTLITTLGVSPVSRDNSGALALHHAAFRGHSPCASVLINAMIAASSSPVSLQDKQCATPLHMAVLGGHYELVLYLLRKGVLDVNAQTSSGQTPLHMAALQGDTKMTRILLLDGGRVDIVDSNKSTVLHCAAHSGKSTTIHALLKAKAMVNAKDIQGNTCLTVAVSRGHLSAVRELLTASANPELCNNDGETTLHVAARVGATQCVGIIMEHFWSILSQHFLAGNKGNRPFVPNINLVDNKGRTALHLAFSFKHLETAKALIYQGCDPVGIKDKEGHSCADIAQANDMMTAQDIESLNKQRIAREHSREKGSPEYQARWKEALSVAVTLFGEKPNKGITHMQSAGLLGTDPEDIAQFLLETPELDKVKIGEYIGGVHEINKNVLRAFVTLLNFNGMEFEMALRYFLKTFRLPGESQVIDRIMQAFAYHYYSQANPGGVFANADAVYVMAFSTIMLNTDSHSTRIKEKDKMTLPQWINQNRKLNDGQNFPLPFLENLYWRIKNEEIKMEEITKQEKKGWLNVKQGVRNKRRWFVLDTTGTLTYYKKPEDKSVPLGSIKLENAEVTRSKSGKTSFTLRIMMNSDNSETATTPPTCASPSLLPGMVPAASNATTTATAVVGTGPSASPAIDKQRSSSTGTTTVVEKIGTREGAVMVVHLSADSKGEMEQWFNALMSYVSHIPLITTATATSTTPAASTPTASRSDSNADQTTPRIRLRLEKPLAF